MSKFLHLLKGELLRLKKYNVLTVSFLVSLIWFVVLYFIEDHNLLTQLLPMLLMVDATMMSIIFVGSTMFFEKSEQTIATTLVTPTSYHLHILSKALANTLQMFLSSMALALIFYFTRQVDINFINLTITLFLTIFIHSLFGFLFAYFSKDFTSMLMLVMAYSVLFLIPTMLREFGVFFTENIYQYLLIISPSQAGLNLLNTSIGQGWSLISSLSLVALVVIASILYGFIIYPKYKAYAVKQSGV